MHGEVAPQDDFDHRQRPRVHERPRISRPRRTWYSSVTRLTLVEVLVSSTGSSVDVLMCNRTFILTGALTARQTETNKGLG